MSFLCTGDWHARLKNPKNRLGNYFEDFMEKLEFILELAVESEVRGILQPGDLGDSPVWSPYLEQEMISLLRYYKIPIYTIPGQHDMRYHSMNSMDRTSMGVLESAGVVTILGSVPVPVAGGFHLYGAGWGRPVPKVMDKDKHNILVTHRMVLKSEKDKLWPGQSDYTTSKLLLRSCSKFELVVCGDNHQGFTDAHYDRTLVNCGALMRAEASKHMFSHKPFVVMWDSGMVMDHQIPVRPADEVLTRESIEKAAERDHKLEAFVSGLTSEYSVTLDFRKNLETYLKENKIDQGTMGIIREVLGDEGA